MGNFPESETQYEYPLTLPQLTKLEKVHFFCTFFFTEVKLSLRRTSHVYVTEQEFY